MSGNLNGISLKSCQLKGYPIKRWQLYWPIEMNGWWWDLYGLLSYKLDCFCLYIALGEISSSCVEYSLSIWFHFRQMYASF